MSKPIKNEDKIIHETYDFNEANQLCMSGEWRQPQYSTKRDIYVLIKRAKKHE